MEEDYKKKFFRHPYSALKTQEGMAARLLEISPSLILLLLPCFFFYLPFRLVGWNWSLENILREKGKEFNCGIFNKYKNKMVFFCL